MARNSRDSVCLKIVMRNSSQQTHWINPEFSPVSRSFGQLDQKRELFPELRLHVSDTLATTVCCSSSDLSSQLDFDRHWMVCKGRRKYVPTGRSNRVPTGAA